MSSNGVANIKRLLVLKLVDIGFELGLDFPDPTAFIEYLGLSTEADYRWLNSDDGKRYLTETYGFTLPMFTL